MKLTFSILSMLALLAGLVMGCEALHAGATISASLWWPIGGAIVAGFLQPGTD